MPGVQSFRHSYPSHSFQKLIKGAGFPSNITVPKVMIKPVIKKLKTCKNVIILRVPSVNATTTSAGVSWRLRCIERLVWVVSSCDIYRYGDLNLFPVYSAAALRVGPHRSPLGISNPVILKDSFGIPPPTHTRISTRSLLQNPKSRELPELQIREIPDPEDPLKRSFWISHSCVSKTRSTSE